MYLLIVGVWGAVLPNTYINQMKYVSKYIFYLFIFSFRAVVRFFQFFDMKA